MKYDFSNKKALIFDFDGVILNSENYKLQSYPQLFTEFPDKMPAIREYINGAAGISRFKKFRQIYGILGQEYTDEIGEKLSKRYDDLTTDHLKQLPLINGVEEFLKSSRLAHYVASSTPIDKLNEIIEGKNLKKYFKQIFGLPVTKVEAVNRAKEELGIESSDITFFGDAIADYNAAKETGTDFIAVTNSLDVFPPNTKSITDFQELL